MIFSALIFFDAAFHSKILNGINQLLKLPQAFVSLGNPAVKQKIVWKRNIVGLLLLLQLTLPWRYLFYPGELFWTEEGYRFSWRVMLMEKSGYAQFKIVDGQTGKRFYVDNSDFLTPFQEKQMSFQPDFILEYAHMLRDHFAAQGHQNIEIYVESSVALNGRLSQPLIDPGVDLTKEVESFRHKSWILPFNDAIQGL